MMEEKTVTNPEIQTKQHTLDLLFKVEYERFLQFDIPQGILDIARVSRFLQQPTTLVLQYLHMLKWPEEPPKENVPMGISWLELYLNFQIVAGTTIPINVTTNGGPEKMVWMDEQSVFTVDSFPYERYVQSFRLCVEHLQKFSCDRLWPNVDRRKTRSLHILGCNGLRNGLSLRPQLPYQRETITALRAYMLAVPTRTQFIDHPKLPQLAPLIYPHDKLEELTEAEFKLTSKNF